MDLFDENKLRSKIVKTWGEHGAHCEVFDMLRTKLTRVEQERKELKAANVSVIQLATDNAKWCLEAKDRAEKPNPPSP